MTPREYLDIVRERWRAVLAGLLVGLVAAGAAIALVPAAWSAPVTVLVAAQPDPTLPPQANGNEPTTQQISTYSELMHSKRLAGDVILALRLGSTPQDLADRIAVTTTPDSALITATVTEASPDLAVRVANSVADQFIRNVAEIEQPADPLRKPTVVAKVFEPAQAPAQQVAPRPALYLLIGALLGLVLGFGAALLRHAVDSRIKKSAQVEDVLGVPVLGAVRRDRSIRKSPLVMAGEQRSAQAEAFRRLRTGIRFRDRSRTLILVTSANAGEGRSTTVGNLALALAEGGSQVLVVDADLRRPSVAGYLGLEESPGLTDVLTDRVSVNWAVQAARPNLDVLTSGAPPPNPGELLGSKQMTDLLQLLDDRYDIVLVDGPALLPVADAAVLASQVDGVLLVVRHGRTGVPELRAAEHALATVSAHLIGAVLTMTPRGRRTRDERRYAAAAKPDRTEAAEAEQLQVAPAEPATSDETVADAPAVGEATRHSTTPDAAATEAATTEEAAVAGTTTAGSTGTPAAAVVADEPTGTSANGVTTNGAAATSPAADGASEAAARARPRPTPAPRDGNGRPPEAPADEPESADVRGSAAR